MPTALTHAVTGAAVATLAPARFRRPGLAIGVALLAVLPDIDVVAFRLGIPYADPLGHRGISDSLAVAFLLALFLTAVCCWAAPSRWTTRAWLLLVVFVGTALHGFLDALSDAGLGFAFLAPFSNARFFLPWRPLSTSPLSASKFLHGRGLQVMQNELLWIWIPVVSWTALVIALRWLLGREGSERGERRDQAHKSHLC